jgi:hypothetical protein|nr:MAG TPA: hypothetical protein [Caudoviricetes sp.]
MFIKFGELPIPFGRLALGAILIDTEGNRYFKVVTEEREYYWVNQLDIAFGSGMSDGLMSKTVEEDWLVLV